MSPHDSAQKIRRLTIALFCSGALNLLFLAVSTLSHARSGVSEARFPPRPRFTQSKPEWVADHRNAVQVVQEFRHLPFNKLVRKLYQNHLVEDGFSRRDFALACLIAFHHFDFLRSTVHLPLPQQERTLLWKEGEEAIPLFLYPDLTEEHYRAIIHFAEVEKWPFTLEGMFYLLRQGNRDESLLHTFTHAAPFRYVEMLFRKGGVAVDRGVLVSLLLEGDWPLFSGFYEEQKLRQDFSVEERQQFLFRYIQQGSSLAAALILQTDGEAIAKKWHNQQISLLLDLLTPGEKAEAFANAILVSPRNQAVCEQAARFLYAARGLPVPDEVCFSQAIQTFAPHLRVVREVEKAIVHEGPLPELFPASHQRVHLVQEGDSLWKIAKKEEVSLGSLKAYNHLEGELLIPGTVLRIPPH